MNDFVTITEVQDHGNLKYIRTKFELFKFEFGAIDGKDIWRLFEASYHSHRFNRPIVAKNQRPRWKRIAIFESLPTLREGGRVPLMADDGSFPKQGRL